MKEFFHRQGAKRAKGAKEKQFILSLPWRPLRPLRLGGKDEVAFHQTHIEA